MRALLIHPRTPPTYWGFQHSLPIAGKAASLPPLGLLSLAPLLPPSRGAPVGPGPAAALRTADHLVLLVNVPPAEDSRAPRSPGLTAPSDGS